MTRVLVVAGGPDAEHDVSVASAAAVAAALRSHGHDTWLHTLPPRELDDCGHEQFAAKLREHRIEVIFPALHGPWGEGGGFQSVLELLPVPYVGAGPAAAALAMDKPRLKARLRDAGHATPDFQVIAANDHLALELPVVLKPVADGSSVDMALCPTTEELEAARARLHGCRDHLLAERLISGRELTIGIIDGVLLPEIEIVPAAPFYNYDAKYDRDDTRYLFDPDLDPALLERARAAARAAWSISGARDLARVDFLVDDSAAWFLELNTMPGFTSHSLLPMAAERAGLPLPQLTSRLIEFAAERRGSCAVPDHSPVTFKGVVPIGRS